MKRIAQRMPSNSHKNVSKQRLSQHESEVDRRSQLPSDIILQIFFFLPLKYWAIMSTLSKRFKHLWTHAPVLDFNELEMVGNRIKNHIIRQGNPNEALSLESYQHMVQEARIGFAGYVNQFLQSHSGFTMKSFHLSIYYDSVNWDVSRVDSWVGFAFTRNIEQVELSFGKRGIFHYYMSNGLTVRRRRMASLYELPRQPFAPRILTTLLLNSCQFKAADLGTFESLKELYLTNVELLDNTINDILSKIPVLEILYMKYCVIRDKFLVSEEGLTVKRLFLINCLTSRRRVFPINITAPHLLTFHFMGTYLEDSSIRGASKLIDVLIYIQYTSADHSQGDFLSSFLNGLTNCKSLLLNSWCFQVLPTRQCSPWQRLLQFQNVKQLRLLVTMTKQELPGLSFLLRSCKRLEAITLDIKMLAGPQSITWEGFVPNSFNFEEDSYWDQQDMWYGCLQRSLQIIRVYGFTGRIIEQETIKFLLRRAVVLEALHISTINNTTNNSVNSEGRETYAANIEYTVMNYQRASHRARIVINQ